MTLKRTLGIVLVFILLFSLAACANNNTSNQTHTSSQSAATASNESPATAAENTASGKKAIVVYFSGSGNTKRVAELVANETGSELFELVPTTPYTDDDLNCENSRIIKEHNDPSLQNTELTSIKVPDWESYDTVLFGYPLWWREAACPVNSFVKGNDFSGKTVIPFCTSTSDGIGDSGSKLAQMSGTGTWQDGMRFPENDDESSIRDWAKSLAL